MVRVKLKFLGKELGDGKFAVGRDFCIEET